MRQMRLRGSGRLREEVRRGGCVGSGGQEESEERGGGDGEEDVVREAAAEAVRQRREQNVGRQLDERAEQGARVEIARGAVELRRGT